MINLLKAAFSSSERIIVLSAIFEEFIRFSLKQFKIFNLIYYNFAKSFLKIFN